MVPDGISRNVFFKMLLDPLLHERYRPVAAAFVDFFRKGIEYLCVPLRVAFRAPSLAHLKSSSAAFVVGFNPSGEAIGIDHETLRDLDSGCSFFEIDNRP